MESKIRFKMLDGTDVLVPFKIDSGIVISLQTDETPCKITVESPTNKTELEFIGGREKRG